MSAAVLADWGSAIVLEPLGFVDDNMNTVGAFVLQSNQPAIISLHPGEDFELNTDIIHAWKVVFQIQDGSVLGDANYETFLHEIAAYIVDQQNGSLLIRALDDDELHELYAKTIFD